MLTTTNWIKMNRKSLKGISAEEFDWLIGLFFADGYKAKEEPRTHRTYFYLDSIKDKDILWKLESILKKLEVRYHKQLKKRHTLFVKTSCRRIFDMMPKTKNSKYFPENKDAFIAGFIDGDGYIDAKRKAIGFSQTIVKWVGPYICRYLRSKNIKPWKQKVYRNCFYCTASLNSVRKNTKILKYSCRGLRAEVSGTESKAQPG